MFERYTEKARRVIFFARYEASNYGSQYIETEHLLLGVCREDAALCNRLLGPASGPTEIRTEIEKGITRRKRISTSEEVPLSEDSRQVLMQAVEECNRFGQQYVVPAHILLGILLVEGSRAAKILRERRLLADPIREHIAKVLNPINYAAAAATDAILTLGTFLGGLKSRKSEDLVAFFKESAEFIDVAGKQWNRGELQNGLEPLSALYANENVHYIIEGTLAQTTELFVASVLWENVRPTGEHSVSLHRMGVVLLPDADGWKILLLQVTAVQTS